MTVRTRVAPSPTGAPHIGTAYVALFNCAFARRHGGRFVLRIEDTDRARSTSESERAILEALRWVGLAWDEGPDVGGPFGPYRQSERLPLYREQAARLLAAGRAYPCFCTPERLQVLRAEQAAAKSEFMGYDGRCAALAPAEARRRTDAGEPHVLRLRVPREGECVLNDLLRGEIRVPWRMVDDQVLMKADGYPTYHLANVVDDRHMEITHVIRGEEWISSLPKHALLYESFGWNPPAFAHLPLLRNPDHSKLSKRRNPTGILYYREAGFLPEALVNFLGLIAYSHPDGRETFTLEELAATFDLKRISLGGPVFDLAKLRSFNGRCLRALPPAELWRRLRDWRLGETAWERIVALAQPRLEQLSDFVPMSAFLFADRVPCDAAKLAAAAGEGTRAVEWLRTLQWEIERGGAWDVAGVRAIFDRIAAALDTKLKKLMPLYYTALTGVPASLPLFDAMEMLGRETCLRRLHYALEALDAAGSGLKGKELEAFAAAYEQKFGRRD